MIRSYKQVPDTKGGVKFNPDGTLDRASMMTIMNPDDKAGLEAALRLKDEYGAEVTVLTMGLPKAEEAYGDLRLVRVKDSARCHVSWLVQFRERRNQVDNVINSIAFELIGKGKDLAEALGTQVTAVLVGSGVKNLADELAEYGADKVIVVDDPELKEYRKGHIPYCAALLQASGKLPRYPHRQARGR